WLAGLNQWVLFITCPLFFFLSWWVVKKMAPAARGSGIPQVMAAIELSNPKENHKVGYLLGMKILITKIISSILMVLGGGAIGREGPTIQIAGSVFKWVNDLIPATWPKVPRKNMVITGAAAGLAAAFNTPLGGIVFAVEELAKNHFKYFRTPLFVAVIIAGLAAQGLLGPYLYLGYPKVNGAVWYIFFPITLIAGFSGIAGAYLSKIIVKVLRWKQRFKSLKQHLLFLSAAALLMVLMGTFVSISALGPGKEVINDLLFSNEKETEWYLPVIRFIGPIISFTAGGAGGVFAPALSAGASIGGLFASLFGFTEANANLLILSGMVGFLTGLTRSPFTSAILVLEMTDRHSVIFHLMLAGMLGNLSAWLIDRKSLYDHLKADYLKEANHQDSAFTHQSVKKSDKSD
ncbi:MAG: chloride channel protein, partial [Chitinophagaceae bacterium]|nr:chloride channel protein [Chitinophagaceae bacterium]